MTENLENEPRAQQVREVVLRSLSKPNKVRFANLIGRSIEEVTVESEGGIYLGRQPAFRLDQARIQRVASRIVRGLFFHEFGYPVPSKCFVTGILDQFGDRVEKASQGIQFAPIRRGW